MSPAVLIFSEDPGATNCILPLLPLLKEHEIPFRLFAAGTASEMYARKDFVVEPVQDMAGCFIDEHICTAD